MAQRIKSARTFWAFSAILLSIAILLGVLSLTLAEFQSQREMELRVKEVNSQNLDQALSLAQNMNRSFAQADTILRFLKLTMETTGRFNASQMKLLQEFSQDALINQVAVADAKGNVVFAAVSLNAPRNIADREQFLFHQKVDTGHVYISRTDVTQVTGTSSIFLSRRLNDERGNFTGVVAVAIAPDYFTRMVAPLQPQAHNSFVLIKVDGTFLTRFPSVDSAELPAAFKKHPVLMKLHQGVRSGDFESPGVSDGIARIGAYWQLTDYPAAVLVGYARAEAFRSVNERRNAYRLWAGMFTLVTGLLFFALWWQLRKQYTIEQNLLDSEARLNQAQAIARLGNWEIDLGSKKIWSSAEAFQIYGLQRREPYFSLSEIQQVVHSEDRPFMDGALQALLTKNEKYDVEFRINRVDSGQQRWIHSVARLEQDERGKPVKIIGVLQDITERKQAEAAIRRSAAIQNVLREITEAALLSASMEDLYESVHRLVDRVLPATLFHINLLDEMTNEIVVPYRANQVDFLPERRPVGKGMTEYVMRLGRAVHVSPTVMDRLRETGEYSLGRPEVHHYLGAPLIDSQRRPFGTIALIFKGDTQPIQAKDVELLSIIAAQVSMAIERKRAVEKLSESEEKFRYMTENSSDVIWHLDRDYRFDYISPADERMRGFRQDEVIGTTFWNQLKPEGIAHIKQKNADRLAAAQNRNSSDRYELEMLCKDGSWIWTEINVAAHNDRNGIWRGLHGVTRDITERKRLEQELQIQARTDGLTGLFNRAHFWARANEELQRFQRYRGVCTLLMIDIDHFKQVNDNYGHAMGDAVLRWISRLCREATRGTDLIGRVGGEEFAILLIESDVVEALQVAERLRQNIQNTMYEHETGEQIPIRVSIGVAAHQTATESLSELMVRADKALYRAKNEGRNKVVEAS